MRFTFFVQLFKLLLTKNGFTFFIDSFCKKQLLRIIRILNRAMKYFEIFKIKNGFISKLIRFIWNNLSGLAYNQSKPMEYLQNVYIWFMPFIKFYYHWNCWHCWWTKPLRINTIQTSHCFFYQHYMTWYIYFHKISQNWKKNSQKYG